MAKVMVDFFYKLLGKQVIVRENAKLALINVIFAQDFMKVGVILGIIMLNCMICALTSTIMFGFTCLRSVCRI